MAIDPKFRRHIELFPWYGGLLECPADASLIGIVCCGIDKTVPSINGGTNNFWRLRIVHLPGSESKLRNAMAVVERNERDHLSITHNTPPLYGKSVIWHGRALTATAAETFGGDSKSIAGSMRELSFLIHKRGE
jgi:hypothetical protein